VMVITVQIMALDVSRTAAVLASHQEHPDARLYTGDDIVRGRWCSTGTALMISSTVTNHLPNPMPAPGAEIHAVTAGSSAHDLPLLIRPAQPTCLTLWVMRSPTRSGALRGAWYSVAKMGQPPSNRAAASTTFTCLIHCGQEKGKENMKAKSQAAEGLLMQC
jgi:hypothetical protein